MKKLALIAAVLLVASAGVANAKGVSAAWNNCDGTGGVKFLTFDCTQGTGTFYEIFHSFQLDATYPGVIAAQAIVTFTFTNSPGVPAWWEMATNGCNDGSIAMSYLRPSGACTGVSNILCGTNLNACSGSGVGGMAA